ncbi:Ccc1 family [Tricladium varicosporioides]|nr:Ccc1 family [Hymenoscyphus varicosporioides]
MSHTEYHREDNGVVRDIIIGFADGLTVPFALTAGLSSIGSSKIVIIGGLAELFAGAISMGLGGFLASTSEAQHYKAERRREVDEVETRPEDEKQECYDIVEKYGISRAAATPLIEALTADKDQWVNFMMKFELGLDEPSSWRALISAGTLALSYFLGGLLPMIPYFAMKNVTHALFVSIGITSIVLILFGYIKNLYMLKSHRLGFQGAVFTLIVGAVAAGASYGIVKAIDSNKSIGG